MELCSDSLKEFVERGETKDKSMQLLQNGPLIAPISLKMIKEILIGLNGLHSLNIVHNDIKHSNILLSKKNK